MKPPTEAWPQPFPSIRFLLEGDGPARDQIAAAALGDAALAAARDGSRPAPAVRELAGRALAAARPDPATRLAAGLALVYCDGFTELDAHLNAPAGEAGPERDALAGIAALRRGRLHDAKTALTAVRGQTRDPLSATEVAAALLEVTVELGETEASPGAALETALERGRGLIARGEGNPARCSWRSDAALAALAQGDGTTGLRLAATEVELAGRFGAPRALGIALRAFGMALGGDAGHLRLAESVEVLSSSGAELELARSRVELGAYLRRSGERQSGRDALRAGLDTAERLGAVTLAERADVELRATGARPRRAALSGVESLTASELRVAELAAAGRSNREIAQELFVTMRTVTTHLTHVYQKLDIPGRDDIAPMLAAASGVAVVTRDPAIESSPDAGAAVDATNREAPDPSSIAVEALAGLSPSARRLAQTLALLAAVEAINADHLPLARQLTGLGVTETEAGHEELAGAGVLDADRESRSLSPLTAHAIYSRLSDEARASGHLDAAELLRGRLNGGRRAAAHLARVPPAGSGETAAFLRAAGEESLTANSVTEARDFFARALAEPPRAGEVIEVSRALGRVEAILRDPEAERHLDAAAGDAVADTVRCGVQLLGGRLTSAHRLASQCAQSLGSDVEPESLAPVETLRACLALLDGRYAGELESRIPLISMLSVAAGDTGWSLELIDGFWRWMTTGSSTTSVRQVERSFEKLLADPARLGDLAGALALTQLVVADDRVGAERTIGALFAAAERYGSVASAVLALGWSSHLQYRTGAMGNALRDAEAARRLAIGLDLGTISPLLATFHAQALLERGDPDRALAALASVSLDGLENSALAAYLWFASAEVELVRGDQAGAVAHLRRCRAVSAGLFVDNPNVLASRSLLARAIAGESPGEARALLEEELALARRLRQPRAIGGALHGLGALDGDVDALGSAAATLGRAPAPLLQARCLSDLADALEARGERANALDVSGQALDLALSSGAIALADALTRRIATLL